MTAPASTVEKPAAKHTPTPWEAVPADHDNSFIRSVGSKTVIAETYTYVGDEPFEPTNAAFIIRAANAHDEMVAALNAAKSALLSGHPDGVSRDDVTIYRLDGGKVGVALDKVRAALLKAGVL